jgi:hypothetical protein
LPHEFEDDDNATSVGISFCAFIKLNRGSGEIARFEFGTEASASRKIAEMVGHGLLSRASLCLVSRSAFYRCSYVDTFIQREQSSREKFDGENEFENIAFELSHEEYEINRVAFIVKLFREQPHKIKHSFHRSQRQVDARELAQGQQEEDGAGTAENRSRAG